jgi:hypothetical protein
MLQRSVVATAIFAAGLAATKSGGRVRRPRRPELATGETVGSYAARICKAKDED